MKKLLVILFVIGALGFFFYLFYQEVAVPLGRPGTQTERNRVNPTATTIPEVHARFLIYAQGTKRVFTESKYHNRSSDAFITPDDPSQIIVKSRDITWQEFFDTLPSPMKVTESCLTTGTGQQFCTSGNTQLLFYLNGEPVPDALGYPIRNGDRLLISYGSVSQIDEQLEAFLR